MKHITTMKSSSLNRNFRMPRCLIAIALVCLLTFGTYRQPTWAADTTPRTFATPQAAADTLINAAEQFDVPALESIFGTAGNEIIHTGEPARDREIAKQFAEQARTKMEVLIDPKSKARAFI